MMKMYEHHDVLHHDVVKFVRDHMNEKLIATKSNSEFISFKIENDLTKAEYNMLVLNNMLNHFDVTLLDEEKAAIEYSIACIKTLDDMGIIKENNDD